MAVGYIASTIPAKVIRTSAHDTLFNIAMRETGDPLQWVAIAFINNLIDPWITAQANILIPPIFPSRIATLPEIPEFGSLPNPAIPPALSTSADPSIIPSTAPLLDYSKADDSQYAPLLP